MRLYKVEFRHKNWEHRGYEFFSRKPDAVSKMKKVKGHSDTELSEIHVSTTRAGIVRALNAHGSHPDNG